jgi:hypothetical protein
LFAFTKAGNGVGQKQTKGNDLWLTRRKKFKPAQANPGKPPVARLCDGLLNLSIWERPTDNGSFFNVTFERRYKNKDEEWASTQSLGEDDLLSMAELMRQAYKEIKHLRSPLREQD